MTTLPVTGAPTRAVKSPPEKTVETLFLRYLLQCFPLGEASLYAPSSREEYVNGYDARVMGASAFWELFLQFKRPNITQRGFTIRLTEHQHRRLRQYPPKTAYYIAATFRSVQEVMDAQRTITDPRAFLSHFIAIDLACLTDDSCFIKYASTDTPTKGMPVAAAFKRESDDDPSPGEPPPPRTRQARHSLHQPCYISAASLLDRFTSKRAGSAILLRRGRKRSMTHGSKSDNAGQLHYPQHPEAAVLDFWDEDSELWEDEIRLNEAVRSSLSDWPEIIKEKRFLVLDREHAEERFESGDDDLFGSGYSVRLPVAPWLHGTGIGGG